MLRSRKMYDLCFRATQGLPLPARPFTALLLQSILARLSRADDIALCNMVWMPNHPHMQLFSLDARAVVRVYEVLKKRSTDFLKRLLGLRSLSLWNGGTSLGEVLDVEAAKDRIVYAFLNPTRARLCQSIDEYEGLNTWDEFLTAPPSVDAVCEKKIPWLQLTDIEEPLSSPNPSRREEDLLIESLLQKTKSRETHSLKIYPFAWLRAFNITDPHEIERIRKEIIQRVRDGEKELAHKKKPRKMLEGFNVTDSYLPPRKDRRIFMFGSTKEIRTEFLSLFKSFQRRCRDCYQQMKQGAKAIPWPPECFIPPAPRTVNVF